MNTVFQTRFGMFVPCDRETYRKLKRIRHLAGFAEVMARRWTRAQRRLPKNRVFRRGRERRVVTDAMLFGPFWIPGAQAMATPLLVRFMHAYARARHPVATIFITRFAWGFRVVMPATLGMGTLSAATYAALDAVAAVAWAAIVALFGVEVTGVVHGLVGRLRPHEHLIVFGAVAIALTLALLRQWRVRR